MFNISKVSLSCLILIIHIGFLMNNSVSIEICVLCKKPHFRTMNLLMKNVIPHSLNCYKSYTFWSNYVIFDILSRILLPSCICTIWYAWKIASVLEIQNQKMFSYSLKNQHCSHDVFSFRKMIPGMKMRHYNRTFEMSVIPQSWSHTE